VTPYSTDGALRAFLTPYSTDGALRAFLAASFKHGTDVRLYRVKKCPAGQAASAAGAAGAAVSRRCGVGVVRRSGRKRAEADGALLLASSGTPYR
jgi:hypothetical protein